MSNEVATDIFFDEGECMMKRIPLAQLRDMLSLIRLQDEKTLAHPYGTMTTDSRERARARRDLIEAIEQALEGNMVLLQTYMPKD